MLLLLQGRQLFVYKKLFQKINNLMKTVTGDYRYENFLYQRVFEYAEYAILNGDESVSINLCKLS